MTQQDLAIEIPKPSAPFECQDDGQVRAILIHGIVVYHFRLTDTTAMRHVAVMLYLNDHATQGEIATAWKTTIRSVNKWVARYRDQGLEGLRDKRTGPPVTVTDEVKREIHTCRKNRMKVREIAQKLNIGLGSVCRVLYNRTQDELLFPEEEALDAVEDEADEQSVLLPETDETMPEVTENEVVVTVASTSVIDPLDRGVDRACARLGLLEDAKPIFADCPSVEYAGALLAVALLSKDCFLDTVKRTYRSIGPAFYGLRTIFVTLFLMAVLRIKTPERMNRLNGLKLGRILGLDRSPSVKTIRRKLRRLSRRQQATNTMNLVGQDRVAGLPLLEAFLYVDGHVQCYYGIGKLGKTFSTSRNQVVSGLTDYWINLADGTPLLCIPTELNEHMTQVLPKLVMHARKLCGGRRLTVIFDRGGSSAAVYEKLLALGCDFIAYNKNAKAILISDFTEEATTINQKTYTHAPYDREIKQAVYERRANGRYRRTKRTVSLREVIVLRDDGGQTAVVTSRRDLSSVRTAEAIFSRWTQENYLKYMTSEYLLDHLCVYGTEPVSPGIDRPNPERVALEKQVKSLRKHLATALRVNLEAMTDHQLYQAEKEFETLHQGKKGERIRALGDALRRVRRQASSLPKRISAQDKKRIPAESRLVTNLVKMTAYHIEGQLAQIARAYSRQINGNERGIVAGFMCTSGSLEVSGNLLRIKLQKQATPKLTGILKHLCDDMTVIAAHYPGTELRMVFDVES